MSINRFIIVLCENCGEESDSRMTETEARRAARQDGWKVGRNRQEPDYCPQCRMRLNDGSRPESQ